eukprot:4916163-Pyramimonas_sp.AAC.1
MLIDFVKRAGGWQERWRCRHTLSDDGIYRPRDRARGAEELKGEGVDVRSIDDMRKVGEVDPSFPEIFP